MDTIASEVQSQDQIPASKDAVMEKIIIITIVMTETITLTMVAALLVVKKLVMIVSMVAQHTKIYVMISVEMDLTCNHGIILIAMTEIDTPMTDAMHIALLN